MSDDSEKTEIDKELERSKRELAELRRLVTAEEWTAFLRRHPQARRWLGGV